MTATMHEIFCRHLGLRQAEVEALYALDLAHLLVTPLAQQISDAGNIVLLQASFPEAEKVLRRALPVYYAWLARKPGIAHVLASPEAMIEWLGDFLLGRQTIPDLIRAHVGLPTDVVEHTLPRLIDMFDHLSFGRAAWQRTIAFLCLVLLVAAQREVGDCGGSGGDGMTRPDMRVAALPLSTRTATTNAAIGTVSEVLQ